MNDEGLLRSLADASRVAPFQPWAKAVYEYRQRNLLKEDPLTTSSYRPVRTLQQFLQRSNERLSVYRAGATWAAFWCCWAVGIETGV